jgi:hypothetical protein
MVGREDYAEKDGAAESPCRLHVRGGEGDDVAEVHGALRHAGRVAVVLELQHIVAVVAALVAPRRGDHLRSCICQESSNTRHDEAFWG